MAQQQADTGQRLRVETTNKTCSSIFLTALDADVRDVEYSASVEKDQLNSTRMQEFATEVEEAMDAQKQLFAQEAGENSDGKKRLLTR